MFLNIAEDDRSDNDENEFKEEQRLEALRKQGVDEASGPEVLLNGGPIKDEARSSANEVATGEVTSRTQSLRR